MHRFVTISRRVAGFVAAACILHLVGLSGLSPVAAQSGEVSRTMDIAFGDHELQKLDVSLPKGAEKPYPVVINVHGGGFARGDKKETHWLAEFPARYGAATIHVNYRLAPDNPYPAAVQDVFCALAWVHSNAEEYGFDTTRVIAWGQSAGGTLAAMLAVVDDPAMYLKDCAYELPEQDYIIGVIAEYPPVNLANPRYPKDMRSRADTYIGGSPAEMKEAFAEASPITWVDGNEPPFLLAHGTDDTLVPMEESVALAEALEKAEVPVELILVEGGTHGKLGPNGKLVEEARNKFFEARFGK